MLTFFGTRFHFYLTTVSSWPGKVWGGIALLLWLVITIIRYRMGRRKNKPVNFFTFLIAKEMIKAETGLFFDVVNDVTVCRYLALPRPLNINHPPKVVQYDAETSNDLPEGYKGFARHLWNKMDDLTFSDAMLDRLIEGIEFFGPFLNWSIFKLKFRRVEGAKWAEKFREEGCVFAEMDPKDRRKLDFALDGYFHKIYNQLKFSGKLKGTSYRYSIFSGQNWVIREAHESELKKLRAFEFSLGPCFSTDKARRNMLLKNWTSFFLLENEFSDIVGSIAILPYKIEGSASPLFELQSALSFDEIREADFFLIKELLFENATYMDIILSNILHIIAKICANDEFKILTIGMEVNADFIELAHYHGFKTVRETMDGLSLLTASVDEIKIANYYKVVR